MTELGSINTSGCVMAEFVAIVIAGLATGALYALVAVGFTLLWQTSQTINFAQGEFVMLPAFFMLAAMQAGLPFWAAIILGFVLSHGDPRLRVQAAAGRSDVATRRAAARDSDHGAFDVPERIGQDLLFRGGFAVSLARADRRSSPVRRRHRVAEHRGSRRRHRGRDRIAIPARRHPHGPANAGRRAESDGRAHSRRAGRTDDPLHFPDQRRPGRAGVSADHADLSGQVHQRRDAGPRRLHRGDRRRLQPDTRRHRGRPAARASSTISRRPMSRRNIAARSR